MRSQCTATSKQSGERCKRTPSPGAEVCAIHGAGAPQVRAKAKERLLEATVAGQLEKRGWQPITDPLPAYADLTGEVWELKEIARQKVAELAGWAYTNDKGDEDVKATLAFYERMLDRTSKALVDMMRLGIDAQALRQSRERPSREVAEQFVGVLQALDLTPEQSAKLPGLLTPLIGGDQ